ncbi:MAG: HlyD family efflux transporter periplasmic adaptor subunit [Moraxella sp.]|nr:HlyD family efflux transporter periplasmic adaptor subunit [Moraxella sp.]
MLRHFLSIIALILPFIINLSACQSELDSNDIKPSSFLHDRKINPPTPSDNAKIQISDHTVILTKAHLTSVRPELYQPSFRLEGVIVPTTSVTVTLPTDGSLSHLNVRLGDKVTQNAPVAHIIEPVPEPILVADDSLDKTDTDTNSLTDDDASNTPNDEFANEPPSAKIVAINAPILGNIQEIFIHDPKKVYPKGTPLMVISDTKQLKFISLLPKKYGEYLSVGKAVNFNTHLGQAFVGQIAKIEPDVAKLGTIKVHVHISPDEAKKAKLMTGDWVSGHIDYDQMNVGALVPNFAIFADNNDNLQPMDLSALDKPPHKPTTPIRAYLWLILQDETIRLTATEIIEYRPDSGQYLVASVPPEALICLARLPKDASGKKVRLDWSF